MKGVNEEHAKLGQIFGEVVTWFFPTFSIFEPFNISGMVEAGNFKHAHKSVQIE